MEDWRKQVTETETPGENGGPPEQASKHIASRTEEAYINSLLERHFDPGTIVLPWEYRGDYERLRIECVMQLKPQGKLEKVLVERIVVGIWRLSRCYRYETGILALYSVHLATRCAEQSFTECAVPDDLPASWGPGDDFVEASSADEEGAGTRRPKRPELLYHPGPAGEAAALELDGRTGTLARLQQREKQIEDSLYRTLHELQRLQAERRASSAVPTSALDVQYLDVDDELRRRVCRNKGRVRPRTSSRN